MAEFQEVMKQAKRMCGSMDDCNDCPFAVDGFSCGYAHLIDDDKTPEQVAEFERIVMDWAAAHPEPRYPSWNEAWKQLFPDIAETDPPCFRYFISSDRLDEFCPGMRCETCRNQPLFADVAEKLGIKPIGGEEDA